MKMQPRRLLAALGIVLVAIGVGYGAIVLLIPPDEEPDYPRSITEVHTFPPVDPRTERAFRELFIGDKPEWDALFREINRLLPAPGEELDKDAAARVLRAREVFEPAAEHFLQVAGHPPYPQYFPALGDSGETYGRFRLITLLHLLEARLLLDDGHDPGPVLEPVLAFLDNYHEGSAGLVDVYLVQSAYSVLLDLFPEDTVRMLPPVRERLERWRATWHQHFIRGISLEFLFFHREIVRVEGSVARHLANQEYFSLRKLGYLLLGDQLFQKNRTLNQYWRHLQGVQDAVRENNPENWRQARAELDDLMNNSPWYNHVGAHILEIGAPDFQAQYERLSTLEFRLNALF